MALSTHSIFYYGFTITSGNRFINFDEGGGELTAQLQIGSFTMDEMRTIIKTAMDAAGSDTYTIAVNRSTRVFTISSTGTFSLLLGTGSQIGASPFNLLGFTSVSDTASASSHAGTSAAGFAYEPQFILQDYIDDNNFQEKIDSKVNESASGELEVINFGTRKLIEFSIKWITNIMPQDGKVIKSNPTGVEDAQAFMQNITTKNPFEFMQNISDRDAFKKLVLERTGESDKGTSYKIDEKVSQGLPEYYDINRLKFRKFD